MALYGIPAQITAAKVNFSAVVEGLLWQTLYALLHVSLIVDNTPLAALGVMTVSIVLAVPLRAPLGIMDNVTGSLSIVGVIHALGTALIVATPGRLQRR